MSRHARSRALSIPNPGITVRREPIGETGADAWIALSGDRRVAAARAVALPGRLAIAGLSRVSSPSDVPAAALALRAACDALPEPRDHVVQAAVEAGDPHTLAAVLRADFMKVADIASHEGPSRSAALPELPDGLYAAPWTEEREALFHAALAAADHGSLDAPPLRAGRSVGERLSTLRATPSFDPGAWCVVAGPRGPEGLVLLSPEPEERTALVASLGVSPGSRRRGLGAWLLSWAHRAAAARGLSRLAMDIDVRNTPALRAAASAGLSAVRAWSCVARIPAASTPETESP